MSQVPPAIGRYRPLALIGSGAMGMVYQAHDPLIDRQVAIKVVRTDALGIGDRAAFLERFQQEVQAAGRCSHPAIVRVYDFIVDTEHPSIVMELVEGASLQQILRNPSVRTPSRIVPILSQVLEGIGAAHGQGVIHRDLKPANIMVTASGQAKIADFGIARLSEVRKTQFGAMLGTPHYMAPEQVADDAVDRRADLFAVGAILYEALTGRPPFAGRTFAETVKQLTGPELADLAPLAARPAYAAILRRALAKDPRQRFQSADEFSAALLQATDDGCQPTVIAHAARTTRRPWDPALLQRLERHLATYLGPMARQTVAHAAQNATCEDRLYATLARGLPNPANRSAFLRALGVARVEPSLTDAGSTGTFPEPHPTRSNPSSTGISIIPADAATAAQTELAFFVGPIARVLVRDAARQTTSPRDFIERLCAHIPKPDMVPSFRRRLRAVVEPRLLMSNS